MVRSQRKRSERTVKNDSLTLNVKGRGKVQKQPKVDTKANNSKAQIKCSECSKPMKGKTSNIKVCAPCLKKTASVSKKYNTSKGKASSNTKIKDSPQTTNVKKNSLGRKTDNTLKKIKNAKSVTPKSATKKSTKTTEKKRNINDTGHTPKNTKRNKSVTSEQRSGTSIEGKTGLRGKKRSYAHLASGKLEEENQAKKIKTVKDESCTGRGIRKKRPTPKASEWLNTISPKGNNTQKERCKIDTKSKLPKQKPTLTKSPNLPNSESSSKGKRAQNKNKRAQPAQMKSPKTMSSTKSNSKKSSTPSKKKINSSPLPEKTTRTSNSRRTSAKLLNVSKVAVTTKKKTIRKNSKKPSTTGSNKKEHHVQSSKKGSKDGVHFAKEIVEDILISVVNESKNSLLEISNDSNDDLILKETDLNELHTSQENVLEKQHSPEKSTELSLSSPAVEINKCNGDTENMEVETLDEHQEEIEVKSPDNQKQLTTEVNKNICGEENLETIQHIPTGDKQNGRKSETEENGQCERITSNSNEQSYQISCNLSESVIHPEYSSSYSMCSTVSGNPLLPSDPTQPTASQNEANQALFVMGSTAKNNIGTKLFKQESLSENEESSNSKFNHALNKDCPEETLNTKNNLVHKTSQEQINPTAPDPKNNFSLAVLEENTNCSTTENSNEFSKIYSLKNNVSADVATPNLKRASDSPSLKCKEKSSSSTMVAPPVVEILFDKTLTEEQIDQNVKRDDISDNNFGDEIVLNENEKSKSIPMQEISSENCHKQLAVTKDENQIDLKRVSDEISKPAHGHLVFTSNGYSHSEIKNEESIQYSLKDRKTEITSEGDSPPAINDEFLEVKTPASNTSLGQDIKLSINCQSPVKINSNDSKVVGEVLLIEDNSTTNNHCQGKSADNNYCFDVNDEEMPSQSDVEEHHVDKKTSLSSGKSITEIDEKLFCDIPPKNGKCLVEEKGLEVVDEIGEYSSNENAQKLPENHSGLCKTDCDNLSEKENKTSNTLLTSNYVTSNQNNCEVKNSSSSLISDSVICSDNSELLPIKEFEGIKDETNNLLATNDSNCYKPNCDDLLPRNGTSTVDLVQKNEPDSELVKQSIDKFPSDSNHETCNSVKKRNDEENVEEKTSTMAESGKINHSLSPKAEQSPLEECKFQKKESNEMTSNASEPELVKTMSIEEKSCIKSPLEECKFLKKESNEMTSNASEPELVKTISIEEKSCIKEQSLQLDENILISDKQNELPSNLINSGEDSKSDLPQEERLCHDEQVSEIDNNKPAKSEQREILTIQTVKNEEEQSKASLSPVNDEVEEIFDEKQPSAEISEDKTTQIKQNQPISSLTVIDKEDVRTNNLLSTNEIPAIRTDSPMNVDNKTDLDNEENYDEMTLKIEEVREESISVDGTDVESMQCNSETRSSNRMSVDEEVTIMDIDQDESAVDGGDCQNFEMKVGTELNMEVN